jgi:hypothetical protein
MTEAHASPLPIALPLSHPCHFCQIVLCFLRQNRFLLQLQYNEEGLVERITLAAETVPQTVNEFRLPPSQVGTSPSRFTATYC